MTGGKVVSRQNIFNVYKRKGIKYKVLNKVKPFGMGREEELMEKVEDAKALAKIAVEDNKDLIFVDECMFTRATLPKKAYSNKKQNVKINPDAGNVKPIALVAGINAGTGLVHYEIRTKSINQVSFKDFIDNLVEKVGTNNCALFIDNLSVHKANLVKEKCDQHGIYRIFNAPYSPQYNPIEHYFGQLKRQYVKIKLEIIGNMEKFDTKDAVIKAMAKVSDETTRKIAAKGIERLTA